MKHPPASSKTRYFAENTGDEMKNDIYDKIDDDNDDNVINEE